MTSSRATRRSNRVRRTASLTLGTFAAAGVAVALGPVRRRLSNALSWTQFRMRCGAALTDDMLADRVRARLEPVTDELHLPPVGVTVANHVATLHGEVHDPSEASVIEEAVAATAGVEGVISHLQRGWARSTVPPESENADAAEADSAALRALLAAARAGGCPSPSDYSAVRTVLAIFFEHLPLAERTSLLSHLPADVRRLATSPRRRGIAISLLANNLDSIVDAVASVIDVPGSTAHDVTIAVLQALHEVLPDEVRAIQAHLPNELADVWSISPVQPESARVGD